MTLTVGSKQLPGGTVSFAASILNTITDCRCATTCSKNHYSYLGEPVTDWILTPVATIKVVGEENLVTFVVEIDGEEHRITADTFASGAAMKRWCQNRKLGWAPVNSSADGRCRDGLYQLLKTAEVPELIGVRVTGLHGNAFVMEGTAYGPDADRYAYLRPANYIARTVDVRPRLLDADDLWVGEGEYRPDEWANALQSLASLHMPEVMTPIIGWMAAAPFRSLFKMFPPLAVCGGAGWGKPTVIKTVMDAFGYGTLALGLNGTTPYGVYSAVSSTNAWPFWFEEYRPGCRQDAKDAVDQALRDAWEAGATARGGTTGTPSSALATPRTGL